MLTFKKGHKYKLSEEVRKKLSLQKMGSNNPNFGKKLSEKTRKKMSVAKKGGNEGSFKKGERKSRKTEFKKGQIPHNKGKKMTLAERKINSAGQKKRWDRIGKQTKEEKNRKNREYGRKKRADNPELEREKERIYRSRILSNGSTVREMQNKQAREKCLQKIIKIIKKSKPTSL